MYEYKMHQWSPYAADPAEWDQQIAALTQNGWRPWQFRIEHRGSNTNQYVTILRRRVPGGGG
jgi:hypothetical protein